jgi:hypothetical protein
MDTETADTRREQMTESGDANMEHWRTSLWGTDPDDGTTDDKRYPPPSPTPPGTVTPAPEEVVAASLSSGSYDLAT